MKERLWEVKITIGANHLFPGPQRIAAGCTKPGIKKGNKIAPESHVGKFSINLPGK